jgi:ParB-like chromosome segregation protein Spo0J
MSGDVGNWQLELLPAKVPERRRATLLLADLTGFEHAMPDPELVEQIGKLGLLQPIVVAGSPQRRYKVIEGRRRAKAVQLLAAEGRWPSPPRLDVVIMHGLDGAELVPAGMMLALHTSRGPSPASELQAIETILAQGDEEARTIKEIAGQTGMPVQTVRRRLRLRNLIPTLRAAFDLGEISVSIAEAAARLTAEQQAGLDKLLAAGERLTLPTIREIVRQRTETANSSGTAPSRLDRKCGRGVCFDLMIGDLTLEHETAASVLAEVSLTANTGAAMARLRWTLGSPWRCGSPGRLGRVLVLVHFGGGR